MNTPTLKKHDGTDTIAFHLENEGELLVRYWSAIGHAVRLERQRDTAREDAERLAQDMAMIQTAADELQERIKQGERGLYWADYISTRCNKTLAAHEALKTKS